MTILDDNETDLLTPPERALLGPFARPRLVAVTGTVIVSLLGWAVLMAMVAEMIARIDMAEAGPGMGLFNLLATADGLLALARDTAIALCGPSGAAGLAETGTALTWSTLGLVTFMWVAMSAAMMTPTAAPMFVTYAQIAAAARERGRPVVSPLVLMAGYGTVWLGFSLLAALAQLALAEQVALTAGYRLAMAWPGAAVLAAAGLYQFSPLKAACLARCRAPFAFFFAHWSERRLGVFALGLHQGIFCLGCCWALMLVMFAAGVMNIVWMALLAIVMIMEKVAARPQIVVRLTGTACLLWAAVLGWSAVTAG